MCVCAHMCMCTMQLHHISGADYLPFGGGKSIKLLFLGSREQFTWRLHSSPAHLQQGGLSTHVLLELKSCCHAGRLLQPSHRVPVIGPRSEAFGSVEVAEISALRS